LKDLHEIAGRSRQSFYQISVSGIESRNAALLRLADLLVQEKSFIFDANRKDYAAAEAEQLSAPLLHRLTFGEEKLKQVILGLKALASMEDPLNRTLLSTEITEGLNLYKVSSPIGVVGVIFESRPDALIQIASLCIKSGNSVLLKGGREALATNQALATLVRQALSDSGLPADTAQLLETREDVAEMLKEDTLIDLIIPRGSNSFVRYIMDHSRIPVLGHSDGICHVYLDEYADPDMAVKVAFDSKVQNVSVCNAMETLLVHEHIAPVILPKLFHVFSEKNVEIRGDAFSCGIIPCKPASDSDWSTEYLDYILSVKVVSSLQEAIDHINRYGSHHTDCIVTEDRHNASVFMKTVDSAGVYWNVSTRFADGFVYGLGAEVGIATGKLHARGPMGLEGLTTYKYKLVGSGQTMDEMKKGIRAYTHIHLNEDCPV
jgi:glutamate-5-semialdehyde dehydrogenase